VIVAVGDDQPSLRVELVACGVGNSLPRSDVADDPQKLLILASAETRKRRSKC
jgi:hypothetical protein